jgi:surface antigen
MNTKFISVLIIASLFSLSACKGITKRDAQAIGVGLFLGGIATYALSRYLKRSDKTNMQSVLSNSPVGQQVGWTNPSTGIPYTMMVTNNNGHCRQFQTVGIIDGRKETLLGDACRQSNGYWKIRYQ